jgi:hypothetical protein
VCAPKLSRVAWPGSWQFCENVGDPHSAIHFGMFYAFLGWVIHPCEMHIDWDFVHAPLKVRDNPP